VFLVTVSCWGLRKLPAEAATVGPRWLVAPVWPTALLVAAAIAALLFLAFLMFIEDAFDAKAPLPPMSAVPAFESLDAVRAESCGGSRCSSRSLTFGVSDGSSASEALSSAEEQLRSEGWSTSNGEKGLIAEEGHFRLTLALVAPTSELVRGELSFTSPEAAEDYEAEVGEVSDLTGALLVTAGLMMVALVMLVLRILSGGSGRDSPDRRNAAVRG
jgi:hypothetical protein